MEEGRAQPLGREAILAATEKVLRRHGPAKATVVDVARELGVSHAGVYRHFPSKAALREAVVRRWLTGSHGPLGKIAGDRNTPAPQRLREWLRALFGGTRRQAADDPELFATFLTLAREESAAVDEHVRELTGQLRVILADGVGQGAFAEIDVHATARAVFNAFARFHHPAHAPAWARRTDVDAQFDEVCELVLRSLSPAPRTAAG